MGSKQMKRLRKALKYQNVETNGMPTKQYFSKISKTILNEDGTGLNMGIICDESNRQYKLAKKLFKKKQIGLTNAPSPKKVEVVDNPCNCESVCEVCNCRA